jgi:hypothetical protein
MADCGPPRSSCGYWRRPAELERFMAYVTQRLAPESRAAVLRLWKDNMSDPHIGNVLAERYQWLYDRNPAGPPTTILAQVEGRQSVGCGSVYPRRMQIAGVSLTAAVPADFAVDRKHRLGGAAVVIQRALVGAPGEGLAFLFGFPNKSSFPVLQRVGYRPVAAAQGWVKPLRAAYKIRPHVRFEFLAAALALPVDCGLAAADFVRPRRRSARAEVVDRADDRFDSLWQRAKGNHPLTGERTSRYLNWRYAEFTTARYRFFCFLDGATEELIGYIVFSMTDGKVSVIDLFAVDMGETAEQLLAGFARQMRRAGCDSIYIGFAGHPDFTDRLRRLGYYASGNGDRKLVALSKNLTAEQESMVFNERSWHMFDGEMDI